MLAIKTFGEQEVFTTKELKKLQTTEETYKYAIPLEINIYGNILLHHYWPTGMFRTVNAKYLHGVVNFHDLKLHDEDNNTNDNITIKCGNCLQEMPLVFDLQMTNKSAHIFSNILYNIASFTKSSHYPAIGIVEVPANTKYANVHDVDGCIMIADSEIKITNIICGFGNEPDYYKHFIFAGYNQENIKKLPKVVKLPLNHNMY